MPSLRTDSSHTPLLAYVVLEISILRFVSFRKLVGSSGLEPPTSRLSGVRSNHLSYEPLYEPYGPGGDERDRTDDPLLAKQVLSQLSYTPINGSCSFGVHTHALEPQKLNNDIELALSSHLAMC